MYCYEELFITSSGEFDNLLIEVFFIVAAQNNTGVKYIAFVFSVDVQNRLETLHQQEHYAAPGSSYLPALVCTGFQNCHQNPSRQFSSNDCCLEKICTDLCNGRDIYYIIGYTLMPDL